MCLARKTNVASCFHAGFFPIGGGVVMILARTVMVLKRQCGFAIRPRSRLIRALGNRGGLSRPGQGAVTQLQQRPAATDCVPPAALTAWPAGSEFWPLAATVVRWRHNDDRRPPGTRRQFFGCEFLCTATCFTNEQAGCQPPSTACRQAIRRLRSGSGSARKSGRGGRLPGGKCVVVRGSPRRPSDGEARNFAPDGWVSTLLRPNFSAFHQEIYS